MTSSHSIKHPARPIIVTKSNFQNNTKTNKQNKTTGQPIYHQEAL